MPILFSSNSNRNIVACGKKREILFDPLYLSHKVLCTSRKIESAYRWNILIIDNFLTFVFFCHIYIQATGNSKGSVIEVITEGSQPLTCNHDRNSVPSALSYSCMPLRLPAEAFSQQETAAAVHSKGAVPDCCPSAGLWLSNFTSSLETTALKRRECAQTGLGSCLNHKEKLLLKWWASVPASLFFQLDTGCHFGSTESKIRFQTSSRLP